MKLGLAAATIAIDVMCLTIAQRKHERQPCYNRRIPGEDGDAHRTRTISRKTSSLLASSVVVGEPSKDVFFFAKRCAGVQNLGPKLVKRTVRGQGSGSGRTRGGATGMRLSDKEAKVLACMHTNADKPVSQVAKETGLQVYTVRYIMRNLAEKGIARRIPYINIMTAGYYFLGIYFSVLPEGAKDAPKLLSSLAQLPEVVWIAELGGDFQYAFSLCVQNMYSIEEYISDLTTRFPAVFGKRALSFQFSVTRFSRGYIHQLAGKKFDCAPLSMTHEGGAVSLDDTDKKVLGALTRYNDESMRSMAQKCGMPLSTFELRVRKLSEKQVILGQIYELNPAELGRQIHKIMISAKSWRKDFHTELVKYAAALPSSVALYRGLGEWDFELNVEVENGSEGSTVTSGLLQRFGNNIASLSVMPKYRDIKHVLVPF